MSTINSYVLRQMAAPLVLTVVVALVFLLTARMLRLLDLVLSSSGSLRPLIQILTVLIPHYVALALPVALFLGIMLAFAGMQRRSELDALAAAGVGISTLLRPALLLTACLALLSVLNAWYGQPYSRYFYRELVHNVTNATIDLFLQQDTFMEISGVTFMAEEVDLTHRQFSRIFIHRRHAGRAETITARQGYLALPGPEGKATLVLQDGIRLRELADGSQAIGVRAADAGLLVFDTMQIPLELVHPELFRERGADERELTPLELWRQRDDPPRDLTRLVLLAELHDRIVRTLSILALPFFAIGYAVGQRGVYRAYVIGVGLLALVLYHEILSIGKIYATSGIVPIAVGQWLPLLLFAVASAYLFHRAAFTIPASSSAPGFVIRIEEFGRRIWSNFRIAGNEEH